MLDAVIRFSLKHRPLIVVAELAVMIVGGWFSLHTPIDVFPDLDRPRVVVLTECTGLAPQDVEMLVTQPIETSMLGATDVQAVRSQSSLGLSVIYVEFDWRVEMATARQVVQERLTAITGSLPDGLRPRMMPPASIMGQFMHVGLHQLEEVPPTSIQQMELRTAADWIIRPRLLQLPGIAEVLVNGGERKQFHVLVDPEAMAKHDVTLHQVEQAIRDNNLNSTGGFTNEGQKERPIRVIGRLGAALPTVEELKLIPVKSNIQRNVLMGQIARIEEGAAPKRGDAGVDGFDGVVLTLVKQPHADTRELTAAVLNTLKSLQGSLPAGSAFVTDLFQLRSFIDRGIYHVAHALVIGAVLVVVILLLFLMNLRTTLITLSAIPLSLMTTVVVFRLVSMLSGREMSFNVMTLGGLAVALGELVDDAIVDVENIFRRLRENQASPSPRPSLQVVYDASREIRGAIVFGTIVVVLVFIPLFALSGVEGRLFTPLGIAYVVSILASLLVSLTITPVLSYYLLPMSRAAHSTGDGVFLRSLKSLASPLIRLSMAIPGVLLAFVWVGVVLAGGLLLMLGTDFLPPFDEGSVQINVRLPPGSSLQASNDVVRIVDRRLKLMQKSANRPNGEILHFMRRTGRAELDEHAEPVGATEYILTMNPKVAHNRQVVLRQLLDQLKDEIPDADSSAEQPLAHLISHVLSGVNAQVAIKIFGDDLDKLQSLAKQVKAQVESVSGVVSPLIEPQEAIDEVHIVLRPDDLAFHGVSRAYVAEVVRTALLGEPLSQVIDGPRRYDLVVKLQESFRGDTNQLAELRIDPPDGRPLKLGEVADFPQGASGPNQLMRENARRRQVVSCNVLGRDLGSAVREIENRIRKHVELPPGYSVELGGQFESQRAATWRIGIFAGMSLVGVFAVLLMLFPSPRIVLQILNAVPTAFIGGVVALALTRQTLSVAALVGFVSLGGIAVRNGILLVTHYLHLMKHEGESFTKAMILRGSLERLSPVLMTALTAGIGLVPLVLGRDKPGLEILSPVATVIVGGLITCTLCEFLIHPGLFWRFTGRDAEQLVSDQAKDQLT